MNSTTNNNTGLLNSLGSVGVDINLTPTSALYLALALILPIVVYFIMSKAL